MSKIYNNHIYNYKFVIIAFSFKHNFHLEKIKSLTKKYSRIENIHETH